MPAPPPATSPELQPPEGVEKVLVALSGGPDSMLLLHMLLTLRDRGAIALSAAHFNHGLRPEAEAEAAFLQGYCRDLGVPLAAEEGDVHGEAARAGRGIEEAGRRLRHAFLRREMARRSADAIALGHHMDDQVETMLMRLGRGSGLTGLCAMRPWQPPLWRPLLDRRKGEILDALSREGIPYFLDASNTSPAYTRNRVRQQLAAWEETHPRFVENATRSARILQDDEDLLAALTAEALEGLLTGGESPLPPTPKVTASQLGAYPSSMDPPSLDAVRWSALPPALRRRTLRLFAARSGLVQDLYAVHIEALERLCTGQSGRAIDLPGGYVARLDFGRLSIRHGPPEGDSGEALRAFSQPLSLGKNPTPWGNVTVTAREAPPRLGQNWPQAAECNPTALQNAVIRPPMPGDRMQPLGMEGHKKLSDIWTDKKVPRTRRAPFVIADEKEVLLLPGLCVSARCDAKGRGEIWEVYFGKFDA